MRCCVLFVVWSACAGGNGPPETRSCEKLRDHLVDLQISDIHIATGVDRQAHRRALASALGDDFATGCATRLSESQVECALAATDSAAAAACVR